MDDSKTLRSTTPHHPYETYESVLDRDSFPVPEIMREHAGPEVGVEPIPTARYTDPAYFEREISHLWLKTWQMVCHVDHLQRVGDCEIYEIVGRSLLIVRASETEIKAFHNSCLHRGRKLMTQAACKHQIKCPFHGLAWNLDGSFRENPIGFDFPQWDGVDMRLPEAKVGIWGGWVFVTFDHAAPPLDSVLAPMPAHFERWRYDECYIAVHVQKVMKANWKAVSEAFMESHHSLTTHPQLLPYISDINSQYDILSPAISRQFSAQGSPSPFVGRPISEEDIIASFGPVIGVSGMTVQPGLSARASMAAHLRTMLKEQTGNDYGDASDAEMLDALLYNVFPNSSFWGGFLINFVYRWRPNGRDVDTSIMDVYILQRCKAGSVHPRPAKTIHLGLDDDWSSVPELGGLARIFDQDEGNIAHLQDGLRSSATGVVHFGKYSEMRLRHQHHMIDQYLSKA